MPLTVRSRRTGNAACRRGVAAVVEALEERSLLTTYTMPLVNSTGLDPSKFSVYVDGFSVKNSLQLAPSSTPGVLTFVAANTSGTVPSFQVGTDTGQYSSIQFDSTQENQGARIYLYVVPAGDAPPSFPFSQQPANPPNYPYPYVYVEYTEPPSLGLPTVDVSTVDAFTLPVTLTLNDGLGQVGQPLGGGSTTATPPPSRPSWDHMRGPGLISRPPLRHVFGPAPVARPPWGHMRGPGLGASSSAGVTRASILAQYQEWAAVPSRAMYRPLLLAASTNSNGQSAGILNPYSYLIDAAAGSPLPAHVASPLNDVFDLALSKIFSTSGWSLQGTDGAVYTAQAGSYQYMNFTNPVTGAPVDLKGLEFTGGGNTYHVFNPLGVNTFRGTDGKAILGSTPAGGNTNQLVLANAPAASALQPGTYVFGTGFDQTNGVATNYITSVSQTSDGTTITLANPVGPLSKVQLVFSPVPTLSTMEMSAGAMVFGGAGFFADSVQQGYSDTPQQTLGNLENQIDAALNRGVAVAPGALNPSTNGATSAYWGTESNWYPDGQPQNLFSQFMHTATVDGQSIYVRASNPASTATGLPMSQVYGFAFDENPGPVPPAPAGQAEVPAKFDPVPAGTTTFTVTLGPWN